MQEWVLNARLRRGMELEMENEGETHTHTHTQPWRMVCQDSIMAEGHELRNMSKWIEWNWNPKNRKGKKIPTWVKKADDRKTDQRLHN